MKRYIKLLLASAAIFLIGFFLSNNEAVGPDKVYADAPSPFPSDGGYDAGCVDSAPGDSASSGDGGGSSCSGSSGI